MARYLHVLACLRAALCAARLIDNFIRRRRFTVVHTYEVSRPPGGTLGVEDELILGNDSRRRCYSPEQPRLAAVSHVPCPYRATEHTSTTTGPTPEVWADCDGWARHTHTGTGRQVSVGGMRAYKSRLPHAGLLLGRDVVNPTSSGVSDPPALPKPQGGGGALTQEGHRGRGGGGGGRTRRTSTPR